MIDRHQMPLAQRITGNKLPLLLTVGALLISSSCAMFQSSDETPLTDDAVREYVDEWRHVKPSIERLAALEGDLSFLLAEVSKMSDLTQTPGQALPGHSTVQNPAQKPEQTQTQSLGQALPGSGVEPPKGGIAVPTSEPLLTLDTTDESQEIDSANSSVVAIDLGTYTDAVAPKSEPTISSAEQPAVAGDSKNLGQPDSAEVTTPESNCPTQYAEKLRKSIAISYFPRILPASSSAGHLHQVDQHLPMLLSANLKTRHGIEVQTQIPSTIHSARHKGEIPAAAQAKSLARQHRSQFLITGEIHDMSLASPEAAYARGPYNSVVKGVTNLINRNGLNTQSRIFKFQLQVRDGFSGQLVFDEIYQTMGNWNAIRPSNVGFGTARFWQTDYGQQVQYLVAQASDSLAATLACQPFTAHAYLSPGTRNIVVQGGANNGFQVGDTLAIYQVMQHPIPGEYLSYYSSLVDTDANVSLVSVYPSHSVAQTNQELPRTGSFLVREP